MGQVEVLEAIARLNEELGRPVTKEEIITATGCTKHTTRLRMRGLKSAGTNETGHCQA